MRSDVSLRMAARRLCASLLAVGLILAGSGHATASDPSPNHCGGTSALAKPKTCTFFFKGFPIRFNASSQATAASAKVWITVDGYPEMDPVEVIGCSDTGSGFASCGGGYPDETTLVEFPPQASSVFLRLRCHFQGVGVWSYGCSAGR